MLKQSPLARRLARGVGANIFDKVVVAASQLLLVPVLARAWGLEAYGGWLILATIPGFLAMSDLGLAGPASVRMTMAMARGDAPAARRALDSVCQVVAMVGALIVVAGLAAAWLLPAAALPAIDGLGEAQARAMLPLFVAYGLIAQVSGLFQAGWRAGQRFALGVTLNALAYAIETAAVVAIVAGGGGPLLAAATLLGTRSASFAVQWLVLSRTVPALLPGLRQGDAKERRALAGPALATLTLPLATALALQGTVVALGAALGAAAVPAFTSARTLSRIGIQAAQLLTTPLMPEFSAALARGERRLQAGIVLIVAAGALAFALPLAALLALWGSQLVAFWTSGAISASPSLMHAIALSTVFAGLWFPVSNLILAENRPGAFAYAYLLVAAAAVAVTWLLAPRFGPTSAALALAIADAAMLAVIARYAVRHWLGHDFRGAWALARTRLRGGSDAHI